MLNILPERLLSKMQSILQSGAISESADVSPVVLPELPSGAMLYFKFLQMFTAYLQFIGRQYSAAGQDSVIFFETNKDLVSTREWKAVSAALDRNQPTTKFGQGLMNRSENPLTDRSSGIGPMHGIEPSSF